MEEGDLQVEEGDDEDKKGLPEWAEQHNSRLQEQYPLDYSLQ